MARSKSRNPSRSVIDLTGSKPTVGKATSVLNGDQGKGSSAVVQPEPRRSGRERSSRLVNVDGHDVLIEINYVVRGTQYHFGEANAVNGSIVKKRKTMKSKKLSEKEDGNHSKKIRYISKAEIMRQKHNKVVQERKEVSLANQLQYFAEHVDLCQPFLSEHIVSHLLRSQRFSVQEIKVAQQPKLINGRLRDYQLAGLNWMVNMHRKGMPMILGDEMGLGKTLQTISFLSYLKEIEHYTGPSLVVCPLSVMNSWSSEIPKWAPELNFLRIHAPNPEVRLAQMHSLTVRRITFVSLRHLNILFCCIIFVIYFKGRSCKV